MFLIFQEEKVITICMLVFLGISIFIRVLLGAVYQSMIKETDNMAATNNKLLKQCKVKFANCYQLNNGVANIPVFVDKFLNRMALGPLSFEAMYHLSGQTMLLSVVSAGVGICKCITDGRMLGEILPFYIASFVSLYLYFSISTVVDIKGRRRILKINLVDYLENHLSARIHVTEQDMEMLYGRGLRTVELIPISGHLSMTEEARQDVRLFSKETDRSMDRDRDTNSVKRSVESESNPAAVTEEELEALLQEFLTVNI